MRPPSLQFTEQRRAVHPLFEVAVADDAHELWLHAGTGEDDRDEEVEGQMEVSCLTVGCGEDRESSVPDDPAVGAIGWFRCGFPLAHLPHPCGKNDWQFSSAACGRASDAGSTDGRLSDVDDTANVSSWYSLAAGLEAGCA